MSIIKIGKEVKSAIRACVVNFNPLFNTVLVKMVFADYTGDVLVLGEGREANGAIFACELFSVFGCNDGFLDHLLNFFGSQAFFAAVKNDEESKDEGGGEREHGE
jgi:hypothetical protein